MATPVKELLSSFEQLRDDDQKLFVFEILRRTTALDVPLLEDADLVVLADDLFLSLDAQEAANE